LREDNEINTHFFFENSFITNLKSLRQQTPADLTIQTLENSTLFRFFATDLLRLYEQSPEIESLGRKLLELLLMEQEDQTRSFQLYSPQQRYQLLLEKQPHILQRISLTHLASYLGISRESLSRIRNRIRE
jgi:CRP-like cAMP-binding protein